MTIKNRQAATVRADLKRLKVDHPDLYREFHHRLAIEQVVQGKDGADRVFFLFERNEDEEWVLRRSDLADAEAAKETLEWMLWRRITAALNERAAHVHTLESAAARFPPERLAAHLELGIRMLQPDFDWDAHEAAIEAAGEDADLPEDVDDVWRLVAGPILYEGRWAFPVPLAKCGSARLDGRTQLGEERTQPSWVSVLAFYRLICRIQPPVVDLSDMYKNAICGVVSADLRFAVILDVFKYTPCLRFYCLPALAIDRQACRALQVRTGIPGSRIDESCADLVGNLFFQFVTAVARTPTMIYGGNDFVV